MPLSPTGGALEFDAIIKDSMFASTIRNIEAQLQGLTKTAEREGAAVDNLIKRTTQAIAGYATFAAGTNFVADIVKVRGEFQQLEVAFTTMLGSKEKSDKLLAEVTEFAATTPFELSEVAGATKQLLAFGISADKIQGTLRSLGDVSAGIGQPLGEIAYLFGTIKTQGVALTQDVRQFAQRGIPIYTELAKVLNVSVEEVGNFITAGKVGFPEIEKAFQSMTAAGSQFGGLMEAQSHTLVGQISNLRDAFDQMLNDFGKSGENIFSGAISSLTFLVDHYQDVLDILKLLVIMYGSYRAAIIAQSVVQAIATGLAKGYTVVELLRYQAILLSQRATLLLNSTLLKNPAAIVIAGLAGIVAALAIFGKTATQAKSKAELLSDAEGKIGDRLAEAEAKIRPYLEQLKKANLSEQERLDIYKKLREIDPKIIEGIDAKTLSYDSLSAKVKVYLNTLREQYRLEANKEAIQESVKQEEVLRKSIADRIKKQDELNKKAEEQKAKGDKEGAGLDQFSAVAEGTAVRSLSLDLEKQIAITEELGEAQVTKEKAVDKVNVKSREFYEGEIKRLKDLQDKVEFNSKAYFDYGKQIEAIENIIKPKKDKTAALDKKENSFLEKKKSLLEDIADMQRGADQSGFSKQQTEIDKINEKYDALIGNVSDYNKKVDEFNRKNPKNTVAKIGQVDLNKIADARSQELSNADLRADAESFKANLETKQKAYEQFEQAKKEVGVEKAKEMFSQQIGDYDSYLKLLQAEGQKLLPKIVGGIANVGDLEKFKAVGEEITKLNEKTAAEKLELEKQNFISLLQASTTYNQQKSAINEKYDKLDATLNKNEKIEGFEDRKKLLIQARQEELDAAKNDQIRQSDLYRKLNQDILGFTRSRIKEEIKALELKLKTDTKLTPQMKADIQSVIDQYKGILTATNKVVQDFEKLSGELSKVSGIFSDLGGAVSGIDDELGDMLSTMGSVISVASDVASAVASFAGGNVIDGIASTVKAITGIFAIGKAAKESRRQAQEEIDAFNLKVLTGEQELSAIIRERNRDQVKAIALRLDAIKAEKDLLEDQKKAVADQYNTILAQLQEQSFVADEVTKKYGGVFGLGRKTKVVQIEQTIGGKSFDELTQLFNEGRLQGKAKELYEQLAKINQEGQDIEALLIQNAEEAREIFTGTTADSIVDSIASGFENGLRSASDFADTFQDLMRKALIESMKFKYLEGPLNDFFAQFAEASQSNNELTSGEIDQLNSVFNSIIETANQQFDQLQQISGLNLGAGSGGGSGNSLQGAIKGITETQAELLAGQFGGLRITALEHLGVGRQQLEILNLIQANTGLAVARLTSLLDRFSSYENGSKILNVKVQ